MNDYDFSKFCTIKHYEFKGDNLKFITVPLTLKGAIYMKCELSESGSDKEVVVT